MNSYELIGTVLAAAGGSAVVIGGVAAWVGNFIAKRVADYRELEFTMDLDLRERRLPVYKELWAKTDILPKWPINAEVTYGQLQKLCRSLKDWYFHEGGHLLSEITHKYAYSPLQEALANLEYKPEGTEVSSEDYELIRSRCSKLRTYLANDLQSRRKNPLSA